MLDILLVVLPVFYILGAGYASVKFGFFQDEHADILMTFTQKFAVPCLLFNALAKLDLSQVFNPELLISYYTGSAVCFTLGIVGARFIFGRRPGESVVIGFSALFSNTVLLGLPIMERAFGAQATEPMFAIIAIHTPFCYLLGITTMELFRADGRSLPATALVVVKAMFSNYITVALMIGFAVNLLAIPIHSTLQVAIDMMVRSALPVALFGLGGLLVRYSLTDKFAETSMVVVIRLIVHPGIAYVLSVMVFDLSEPFVRAAVITAAMAPGVNTYVFANIYARARGTAASALLIGTAVSILSVSGWLYILNL